MKRKQLLIPLVMAGLLLGLYGCKTDSRITEIYGTVIDEQGKPVKDFSVWLIGFYGTTFIKPSDILKEAKSDADGKYSVLMDVPDKYEYLDFAENFIQNDSLFNSKIKRLKYINPDGGPLIGRKTEYSFIVSIK